MLLLSPTATSCAATATTTPASSKCRHKAGPCVHHILAHRSFTQHAAAGPRRGHYAAIINPMLPSAAAAAAAAAPAGLLSLEQHNLILLQQLVTPSTQLSELLQRHPLLPQQCDLAAWCDFLTSYGLRQQDISRLLVSCPELFESSNIYSCGQTLLFFKGLGWRDADILGRIIPQYPGLLAKELERDILPVLEYLSDMGCSPADVRLLVWEFPRIFTRNFKRDVRKFQYLGLYGLPAPGTAAAGGSNGSSGSNSGNKSCGNSTDSLARLLLAFH